MPRRGRGCGAAALAHSPARASAASAAQRGPPHGGPLALLPGERLPLGDARNCCRGGVDIRGSFGEVLPELLQAPRELAPCRPAQNARAAGLGGHFPQLG